MKTNLFTPLPLGPYDIILADPPWDYDGRTFRSNERPYMRGDGYIDLFSGDCVDIGFQKSTLSADYHYDTIGVDDLKKLPVADVAADACLLFMWCTGPHMNVGIELGKAWGFKYVTIAFCWDKVLVNPGNYTMSQFEYCLVFKKGAIPQPRGSRNERQLITWRRGAHSVKPSSVHRRLNRMFPAHRKLELFARRNAEGFDVWGNELQ